MVFVFEAAVRGDQDELELEDELVIAESASSSSSSNRTSEFEAFFLFVSTLFVSASDELSVDDGLEEFLVSSEFESEPKLRDLLLRWFEFMLILLTFFWTVDDGEMMTLESFEIMMIVAS